ncbi:hypothetical protein ACWDBC_00555 [Streptomyces parvus]|uniref:hypothetical protein n=1 Tax=Streptomyces parvus TaxID=66428 RepID=UPI00331BE35D|nr:hypothetical protein [Streptomyces globisporus]
MGNSVWRASLGVVGAGALCWGVAGAVHLGFVQTNGPRRSGWGLADGGGWYEVALVVGALVTLYCTPGLLRRVEWWPALGLSAGAVAGVVSVLALGQGRRYWVAASVMTLVGVAVPLSNRFWGRHHPI